MFNQYIKELALINLAIDKGSFWLNYKTRELIINHITRRLYYERGYYRRLAVCFFRHQKTTSFLERREYLRIGPQSWFFRCQKSTNAVKVVG